MTAARRAAKGDARFVMIGGEPGIGKTRLAAEIAGLLHGEGNAVLFGRCSQEPLLPYEPFVEALRTHASTAGTDELPQKGHAGVARQLRPQRQHSIALDAGGPLEPDGARRAGRPARTSFASSRATWSTKRSFLSTASIKVNERCGFTMASGNPGNPAPVPTSAIVLPTSSGCTLSESSK